MKTDSGLSRRQLLQAALAAPIGLAGCATTPATGVQRLRAEDPVARSLLYVPDTRRVPAGNPLAARHDPTQRCAGCIHVRGNAGDTWRPCPVFPARLVNADGWCSVWAPR
jgi:hypothetical protein